MFATTDTPTLHRISAGQLRSLGKQASLAYESGVPLSEAVTEVLRDHPDLNQEQIKRVVEFSNNAAFDQTFRKMGGDHRVVDFDGGPAKAGDVINNLRSLGADRPVQSMAHREQYMPGLEGAQLVFMKTATEDPVLEKVALDQGNPYVVVELLTDLIAAREKLASNYRTLGHNYTRAAEDLYAEARHLMAGGTSPVDVVHVVKVAAKDTLLQRLVLKTIYDRAEAENLPCHVMTKEASVGLVNPESKLFQRTVQFTKIATEWFNYAAAIENLNERIGDVRRSEQGRYTQ